MQMLPVQVAMPNVLKKYGLRKCPTLKLARFLETFFFFKNLSVDSEVDTSFKLTWCLDFPCAIRFMLFICRKAAMDFGKIHSLKFSKFFFEISSPFSKTTS